MYKIGSKIFYLGKERTVLKAPKNDLIKISFKEGQDVQYRYTSIKNITNTNMTKVVYKLKYAGGGSGTMSFHGGDPQALAYFKEKGIQTYEKIKDAVKPDFIPIKEEGEYTIAKGTAISILKKEVITKHLTNKSVQKAIAQGNVSIYDTPKELKSIYEPVSELKISTIAIAGIIVLYIGYKLIK